MQTGAGFWQAVWWERYVLRPRGYHHETGRIQTPGHRTFPWALPSGPPATNHKHRDGVGGERKEERKKEREERMGKNKKTLWCLVSQKIKCSQVHTCLALYVVCETVCFWVTYAFFRKPFSCQQRVPDLHIHTHKYKHGSNTTYSIRIS